MRYLKNIQAAATVQYFKLCLYNQGVYNSVQVFACALPFNGRPGTSVEVERLL